MGVEGKCLGTAPNLPPPPSPSHNLQPTRPGNSSWELPEVIGCVALQQGGRLLLPLESGIFSFNPSTGTAQKLCDFEPELGSLTRPNDGRVDREGNFVIGSYNNAHRQVLVPANQPTAWVSSPRLLI